MNLIKNCSKLAALACALGVASCTTEESPEAFSPASSALENPIAACQAELATCQSGGSAGCGDQMRACLTAFAQWLSAVQTGVEACRQTAAACATSGGNPLMCRSDYDSCVMMLATDDSGSSEDAGVEEDAGAAGSAGAAGRGGRGPGRPGRGGAAGGGGFAGRGGWPFTPPGGGLPRPGLPGRGPSAAGSSGSAGMTAGAPAAGSGGRSGGFPGASPEVQCMEALGECMTSGRDIMQCADEARRCLRDSRP